MTSVFETLSTVDVNEHVENKNGFTYLSWSWAWATLKSHYPDASFVKHVQPDGKAYISDEEGYALVEVTVTAGGESATELYPVTDYANRSIKNPTAFDINNAFQRGMTKAMAYLGLGLYIYAGEDVPPSPSVDFMEFKLGKDGERIGTMINTFAWKPEDKKPRSFFYWDDWATVCCAWIDAAQHLTEKKLNEFVKANGPVIKLAEEQSHTSFESVRDKVKAKREELKEKS